MSRFPEGIVFCEGQSGRGVGRKVELGVLEWKSGGQGCNVDEGDKSVASGMWGSQIGSGSRGRRRFGEFAIDKEG